MIIRYEIFFPTQEASAARSKEDDVFLESKRSAFGDRRFYILKHNYGGDGLGCGFGLAKFNHTETDAVNNGRGR